jgi:hypothetical protein
MKVGELAKNLKADIKVVGDLERDVTGCYVSDLLSDVLANSKEGELWITHQSHPNVVAVASVRGLSGVVITGNREIEPETIKKAEVEQVNIITSTDSTFKIVGAVYNLLQ